MEWRCPQLHGQYLKDVLKAYTSGRYETNASIFWFPNWHKTQEEGENIQQLPAEPPLAVLFINLMV